MKHCTKCGQDKPLTEFHRSVGKPDGHMSTCKACKRQSDQAWRDRNRDKIKTQSAAWAKANKARKVAKRREWEMANGIRVQGYRRAVDVWSRGVLQVYQVSQRDLRQLLTSPCIVDGCTSDDMTVDHLIPVSRGGSHGIGNLAPMCRRHNSSKNRRTWMEYRVYLAAKRAKAL